MSTPLRTTPHRHLARRCLRCGYDGALLKDGRAPRCSRCGCDLRERPARSYAEMEGFTPIAGASKARRERAEQRVIERWLAVVVVALMIVVGAAVLLARLV